MIMKREKKVEVIVMLVVFTLVVFSANSALASIGGSCVSCHTMHNSQDGANMLRDSDSMTPNSALLRASSCLGCHGDSTVANGAWSPDFISPQVTAPAGQELAGGSFYWVMITGGNADAKGHNVMGIAEEDTALGLTPPGWNNSFTDHENGRIANGAATWTDQLTCAGTVGCHGKHEAGGIAIDDMFAAINGGHHDESVLGYRMLNGIEGFEDDDWEWTKDANDHNQYKGSDGTTEDKTTISYLCAECHGAFHTASDVDETGSASWLRHPSDFDMNTLASTSEYFSYNGGTGSANPYSVVAPVASTDVSAVKGTVFNASGDAIVTCISCHRPHGSENDDLLRWAYNVTDTLMAAGSGAGNVGCFICHTTKN